MLLLYYIYIYECHKVRLSVTLWLSPGTHVSSTNKTDRHDLTEIVLKWALNTIFLLYIYIMCYICLEDADILNNIYISK